MKRRVFLAAIALVLALCGGGVAYYIASQLEEVTTWRETPMKGPAAVNSLYATQQLVRHLGGQLLFQDEGDVARWPKDATLLLVPRKRQNPRALNGQLKQWVRQGGHLVVPVTFFRGSDWGLVDEPKQTAASGTVASPPACVTLAMTDGFLVTDDATRKSYELCLPPSAPAYVSLARPLVAYASPEGHQVMRFEYGKGTVTTHNLMPIFFQREPLRADHAFLISFMLQLGEGRKVLDLSPPREPFLEWLWNRAWVVLCLTLAALALAWWRGARRFGPMLPPEPLARRSMREQIRGSGRFVCREGGAVLHRAVLRALEDAAAKVIPAYAAMSGADRARALAARTGFEEAALLDAFVSDSAVLDVSRLQRLECARRRLHPPTLSSEGNQHALER